MVIMRMASHPLLFAVDWNEDIIQTPETSGEFSADFGLNNIGGSLKPHIARRDNPGTEALSA